MLLLACVIAVGCSDNYEEPPILTPEGAGLDDLGDGTWENPLQTWQAHNGATIDGRTSNWVTGYIVGWIDTSISNTMKENTLMFGSPCNVETNMVIAQYQYDKEKEEFYYIVEKNGEELHVPVADYTWDKCVSVQLPSGGVRTALNLATNPGNFNRQVTVKGTTGSKYCGVYGVRSVADYNWGDKGKYEEPITPIGTSYYCNFEISADINYYIDRGWRLYCTKGTLSGWYVKQNGDDQFATVSAYLGTAYGGPYENWLVSPGIEIDEADAKTVSFITQAGYTSEDATLEVYVMPTSNPNACVPVRLECPIAQAPDSGFSEWQPSGDLSLEDFHGKIYIGFRFYSSKGGDGNSTEYHLDNFNLGGAVPPADPNEPVIEDVTYVKADKVYSGRRYAMLHGLKDIVKPIGKSNSYGYLTCDAVQMLTSDSFVASSLYAFTFEEEGEGFVIRDGNGRYLWMNPSYQSFQVSKNKPSSNYLWKVEEQNGRFKITNIGAGRTIEWASNFSNYSTVPEADYSGDGPKLFMVQE